jgi:ABC-type multidrug transport system fused ATPase/permease subunit
VLTAVRFAYAGRGAPVLDGVTLELSPGRMTALVGPSGAGKTTLALLVARLADPQEGTVTCGGVDLRDVDPRAWRERVAWVPQRATLFAGTIADNVRLARPEASEAEVTRALAAAGADALVASLPGGARTRVGDGGRRLSAGQSRRIALARAFLDDAPLVILDEPTAHLDPDSAAAVESAVARLADGRTVLLITHRRELARRCDRVLELRDGAVAERRAVETFA